MKTAIGENGVFVLLRDSLTIGEQTLAHDGEGQAVRDLRRRWQRVVQAEVSREVERLTGRKVIDFMSDNHIDPRPPGRGLRPRTAPRRRA